MKSRLRPIGFIVVESCDDYEQILSLEFGDELPAGGILVWPEKGFHRVIFRTKSAAREAIKRTEHYRLAFGLDGVPEAKLCSIHTIAEIIEKQP
jgi:hypothetical protein